MTESERGIGNEDRGREPGAPSSAGNSFRIPNSAFRIGKSSAFRTRKNPLFTNPFFATLVVVSIVFVVTIFAYLAAPYAINARPVAQGDASRVFALWIDRHGPMILGVEFVVMLATGVLAMITDDWFSSVPGPAPRKPLKEEQMPKSAG
jgi:hypothetical protein